MKFLLTSSGISNDSIHNALVESLGKPIAESSALVIPTAWYAYPGGLAGVYQLIHGVAKSLLCELGVEVVGRPGAHRAPQYQERELGPAGPRG